MEERYPMNFDYAVHSDFLIHWTGKDIDRKYDSKWLKSDKSKTNGNVTAMYMERLLDILQFGFWMTKEKRKERISYNGEDIEIKPIARTCFTELKLSESRKHARNYGRLGIGVKRPFLFKRFGRPLIYYGYAKDSTSDIFLKECADHLTDKKLLNFFKPMNRSSKTKNYDFYSESEWRILYDKRLEDDDLIVDPRKFQNKDEQEYYNKHKHKMKYLIPLDGWLAMIIYPSLDVKNEAQQGDGGKEIREAIKEIKGLRDEGNETEGGNWPIEVALDDCRNF